MKLAITQCYVYLGFNLKVESLSTADLMYEYKDIGPLRVAGDLNNLESFKEVNTYRQLPMSSLAATIGPSTVLNEAAGIRVAISSKCDIR